MLMDEEKPTGFAEKVGLPPLLSESSGSNLPHEHDFSLSYRLSIFKKNGPCQDVVLGEMCSICGARKVWRREREPIGGTGHTSANR